MQRTALDSQTATSRYFSLAINTNLPRWEPLYGFVGVFRIPWRSTERRRYREHPLRRHLTPWGGTPRLIDITASSAIYTGALSTNLEKLNGISHEGSKTSEARRTAQSGARGALDRDRQPRSNPPEITGDL
jgi:hypothetical protein